MDVSRGAPFLSSEMHVEPSWIDHNGHLNMAYYHVLLDRASDEFWVSLGLGPRYIETTRCSTFAAECHIRYLREVHLKDQVRTAIFLIGADEKRLHTFRQLYRSDGSLAATSENMSLHVDLNTRKVVAFPSEIKDRLQAVVQLHQRLTPPSGIGRRISMKAR
ncbi:thioesterase family protein [Bradyrhizobium sp. USDA 4486]